MAEGVVARLGERAKRGLRWLSLGSWRQFLPRLLVLGVLLGSGGLLAVWAGFSPVSASAGHWPITDWFLHFAMRRAVEMRASSLQAPPLDSAADQLKGAGHYAAGCAACHGAPGQVPARVTRAITPPPPYLPERIAEWRPEELFWIVKHGVKFTAMPAWPSQARDDEVWAMVAFLRLLPELTPAQYRRMSYGDAALEDLLDGVTPDSEPRSAASLHPMTALGEALTECSRCHGADGAGRGAGAFPRLAGQRRDYLLASLRAYATGTRESGVMQPVAEALSEEQMVALAEYYSLQSVALPQPSVPVTTDDSEAIERGRRLAVAGGPKVPSCQHCHGPGDSPRNALYPELAGQYADYLLLQLRLFAQGGRGGTDYAHLMEPAVAELDEGQMRDLALYYASLEPAPPTAAASFDTVD